MTSLAAEAPSVLNFEATARAVERARVVLEATYFYPEGGGQPADRGAISGIPVVDVQKREGEVVHELAAEPDFGPGATVEATIDAAFRTYCMRAHTASHVLYGAGRRLLSDLGYGGFDIGEEKVRVDLATPTPIDDDGLVELERLANRAVWDALDVSWESLPREEALAREDVAFNATTEEGLDGDAVRIVTIEDWDVAACGGTHVANTSEIGPVAVLDRSNPGEGLTRVEFAVGPTAIERRATERRRAMQTADRLETGIEGLPDAVDRLLAERDDRRRELDRLREDAIEDRLEEIRGRPVEVNGHRRLVGALPSSDANDLAGRARDLVEGEADVDVAALVGEEGGYLAVSTSGEVDAESIVETVTDEFGGGGGGGPTVAQAGGLDAEPEDVVAFLGR